MAFPPKNNMSGKFSLATWQPRQHWDLALALARLSIVKTSILIIASGSKEIGTGHLSRQFELASLASRRGFEVFLFGSFSQAWHQRFTSVGVRCYAGQEFPTGAQTLEKARELELNPTSTWIIRDNYGLEMAFSQEVSRKFSHLVHFDDLPGTGRTYEILVNSGVDRDSYDSNLDLTINSGEALLAAGAAIIRSELRILRQSKHLRQLKKFRKGLVSFGFSDPTDATYDLWQCMGNLDGTEWNFLLGPDYSGSLMKGLTGKNKRTFTIEGLMNEDYFNFDLGIGAGGVSAFERAFCGIPSLNFALLENQKGVSHILDKGGASIRLETANKVDVGRAIATLLEPTRWAEFRDAGMELVDGRGGDRLLDMMVARRL